MLHDESSDVLSTVDSVWIQSAFKYTRPLTFPFYTLKDQRASASNSDSDGISSTAQEGMDFAQESFDLLQQQADLAEVVYQRMILASDRIHQQMIVAANDAHQQMLRQWVCIEHPNGNSNISSGLTA